MPVRIQSDTTAPYERSIVVPSVPDSPRPRGVYLLPDPVNPDRTVIEIWGREGECLNVSSIQNDRAGRFTEVLCYRMLDDMDPPPRHLTLVSA